MYYNSFPVFFTRLSRIKGVFRNFLKCNYISFLTPPFSKQSRGFLFSNDVGFLSPSDSFPKEPLSYALLELVSHPMKYYRYIRLHMRYLTKNRFEQHYDISN